MKNYFKSTIAILAFSSFTFTSCLDLTPGATDAEASLRQTVAQSMSMELPQGACDFDDRKTVDRVREETGIVVRIANTSDPENPTYIIDIPNEGMRYTMCNMPDAAKRDGMKITFDAEKKEIYANERWAAHPSKLTRIYSATGGDDDTNDEPMVMHSID